MKRIWKEYFTFSKKERIAVITLLFLIACFIVLPHFYPVKRDPPVVNIALRDFASKMDAAKDSGTENGEIFSAPFPKIFPKNLSLFTFDPNTLSEDGWNRLGVYPRTVHTIINYRNKGGRFRLPEDIRKIWGMRKKDADRLIPFVQITQSDDRSFKGKNTPFQANTANRKTGAGYRIIDINTATPEDWKILPGIGDVLAARIVKYRERVGGFTDILQVKKTYGISDSVFGLIVQWLKTDAATMTKMNLNTVSAYDLRVKANIPDAVARAIVLYRQQSGPYLSVDDLKKIVFIKDSLFQKILPHVRVE